MQKNPLRITDHAETIRFKFSGSYCVKVDEWHLLKEIWEGGGTCMELDNQHLPKSESSYNVRVNANSAKDTRQRIATALM